MGSIRVLPWGAPLDDTDCVAPKVGNGGAGLNWVEYLPDGAGPWPCAVLWHGGGFFSNDPYSAHLQETAALDLNAAGFMALSPWYRLVLNGTGASGDTAKPEEIVFNQNSPGTWNIGGWVGAPGGINTALHSDQVVDVKAAQIAALSHPKCNGYATVLGGSGGGNMVAHLCCDHETVATAGPGLAKWGSSYRPFCGVSMSGAYFIDNRESSTFLNAAVRLYQQYCEVADDSAPNLAKMHSCSVGWNMDANQKPMFLIHGINDFMPPPQYWNMVGGMGDTSKLQALGITPSTQRSSANGGINPYNGLAWDIGTGYDGPGTYCFWINNLGPGNTHAWAHWTYIGAAAAQFVLDVYDDIGGAPPPPPPPKSAAIIVRR